MLPIYKVVVVAMLDCIDGGAGVFARGKYSSKNGGTRSPNSRSLSHALSRTTLSLLSIEATRAWISWSCMAGNWESSYRFIRAVFVTLLPRQPRSGDAPG